MILYEFCFKSPITLWIVREVPFEEKICVSILSLPGNSSRTLSPCDAGRGGGVDAAETASELFGQTEWLVKTLYIKAYDCVKIGLSKTNAGGLRSRGFRRIPRYRILPGTLCAPVGGTPNAPFRRTKKHPHEIRAGVGLSDRCE